MALVTLAPPHIPQRHSGMRASTLLGVEGDAELLAGLRNGDEQAFIALVRRYQPALLRFAESLVGSRAVAEEVVQDTWMGVVRGVDNFEGRSAFKTWLFRILANRARTAAGREQAHRRTELSPAVDPDRFDANGAWAQPVVPWPDEVDERLDAAAYRSTLRDALQRLPDRQRQVVLLRDVDGLTGPDVCAILGISGGTQRILLHRARARLRDTLDHPVERA